MKLSIFLLSLFIAVPTSLFSAQKNVHKLAEEQETARKRQKTEEAEFASTNSPMGMSHTTPINSEQTTTSSSSSCTLQEMEDIEDKSKSEAQERSSAQQEFFDMFYQLAWNCGSINLDKLEQLLQDPSALNLEAIIDTYEHETALHIASRAYGLNAKPRLKTMQLLLAAGANVNARNRYRMTPLLYIAKKQKELCEDFINLLLHHGADITAQSNSGKTIIDLLDIPDLALHLLAVGAPLPQLDEWKSRELFIYAIQKSNLPAVVKFTHGGMNINFILLGDRTPLMHAIRSNNVDIVKVLLQAGAQVNIKNRDGDIALHDLDPLTKPEIVKLIIDAGANVNLQDCIGQTPLLHLLYYLEEEPENFNDNTYHIIQLLLKGNAQYGPANLKLQVHNGYTIDDYLNIDPEDDEITQKVKQKIQKIILEYRLSPVLQKQAQEYKARRATARAAQRSIENYLEKSEQSEKLGIAQDIMQHTTPFHYRTHQEK